MSGPGPTVPREMARIVMKLLRRDPRERFQSARELRDALQRLVGDAAKAGPPSVVEGTPAQPGGRVTAEDGPPDRARRQSRSRRPARGAVPEVRTDRGRRRRLTLALMVLLIVTAVGWAQPWGRTLDREALAAHVASGAVSQVYLTEGGLEGGLQIVPVEALQELRMPFFVPVAESDIAETVDELRGRNVEVDASWEIRRLTALAVDAQTRGRYYGLDGGDVRSYARRLAELDPGSQEAASLLFKVGERMAWDAAAALGEGADDRARALVQDCLDLVPDQPRCLQMARSL